MKEIQLTRGFVALVDDEDYTRVSVYAWHIGGSPKNWYAMRTEYGPNHTRRTILMHKLIMEVGDDVEIDHVNRNTLDCRRHNMRIASRSQNNINRFVPQGEEGSGYRGVSRTQTGKWQARIRNNGVRHYLGVYNTAKEAALVWDAAALEMHGEFAVLNFPQCKE